MKKRPKTLFPFFCVLGLLCLLSEVSSQQTAAELFGKALYLEEAQGELQKAIGMYEKILAQYPGDREVAAKAQLHIGLCYEKLGLAEAQKAFQKVVENYPDQSEAVKVAREKLSALARAQALIEKDREDLTIRLVWAGPWVDTLGTVSPDGQSILYQWYTKDEIFELRILDIKKSTSRTIYQNQSKDDYVHPFDWSPDGKSMLAGFYSTEETTQLGLISVEEGSMKVLKTYVEADLAAPKIWGFVFSPDGKYIAYDASQEDSAYENKDIFLLAADGSTETPLIKHPAIDTVIDWTPDGKGLLFISNRTGTQDVWLMRLAGGGPQGEPQLLKAGVGRIEPMGVTLRGELYYGLSGGATDVYEVGIDVKSTALRLREVI